MRNFGLWAALLGAASPGCDSETSPPAMEEDDYLGREAVTSIPDGDAVGNGFSGGYQARATTVSCTGACDAVTVGGTSFPVCERDVESIEWVAVSQEDGHLRVDLDDDGHIGINLDGYVPTRLEGGIDADGTWEVGGYGTKFNSRLESTARARGTLQPDAPLDGTVEVHTYGIVDDVEVDCYTTHHLASQEEPE